MCALRLHRHTCRGDDTRQRSGSTFRQSSEKTNQIVMLLRVKKSQQISSLFF